MGIASAETCASFTTSVWVDELIIGPDRSLRHEAVVRGGGVVSSLPGHDRPVHHCARCLLGSEKAADVHHTTPVTDEDLFVSHQEAASNVLAMIVSNSGTL